MRIVAYGVAAALLLSGCSSRPREFTPALATPASDQTRFTADVSECRQLLVAGKLDGNGRLASAGAGVAAGAATMVGGAAAASSIGLVGGAALASATVVAIPFVAIAGAIGMAKAKRNRKERVIQTALAGCLEQRGYRITGWDRANG